MERRGGARGKIFAEVGCAGMRAIHKQLLVIPVEPDQCESFTGIPQLPANLFRVPQWRLYLQFEHVTPWAPGTSQLRQSINWILDKPKTFRRFPQRELAR